MPFNCKNTVKNQNVWVSTNVKDIDFCLQVFKVISFSIPNYFYLNENLPGSLGKMKLNDNSFNFWTTSLKNDIRKILN